MKEEKKKHDITQLQIEEKYKASVQLMNQAWILIKKMQQTQEMIVSSMSKVLNQVIFPMCSKFSEIIQLVITRLKTRIRNIEVDDITELINNQVSCTNDVYKEFDRHQEELRTISSKQNEALVTTMVTLLQYMNG